MAVLHDFTQLAVTTFINNLFNYEIHKKGFKEWFAGNYRADAGQSDGDGFGAGGSRFKI